MRRFLSILILLGSICVPFTTRAEDRPLKVAVLPFESNEEKSSSAFKEFIQKAIEKQKDEPKNLTLGTKISELLTSGISSNPAIELVERAAIDEALDELALGKTGIVDETQAARIGHMVGAQVLVMGKAFPLDDELFIVAKVVGVETSRVFAAKTSGPLTGRLAPMVDQLSQNVSKTLLKHDAELVGKDTVKKDYAALIQQSLGNAKRPVVSITIKERHVTREAADPTVETELTYLLRKTGFDVLDEKNKPLSDWALAYLEDSSRRPPTDARADVVIVGEAFSELAGKRGDLISCKARVELRALDIKTGKVLAIERKTATAVDIAEQIAAKNALQSATDDISETLVPGLAKEWAKQ